MRLRDVQEVNTSRAYSLQINHTLRTLQAKNSQAQLLLRSKSPTRVYYSAAHEVYLERILSVSGLLKRRN